MDFLGIGVPELMVILIIALLVVGPRRLPSLMADIGKYIRELRNMSENFRAEWQKELSEVSQLEEIKSVKKELEEINKLADLEKAAIKESVAINTAAVNGAPTLPLASDDRPAINIEMKDRQETEKQGE